MDISQYMFDTGIYKRNYVQDNLPLYNVTVIFTFKSQIHVFRKTGVPMVL